MGRVQVRVHVGRGAPHEHGLGDGQVGRVGQGAASCSSAWCRPVAVSTAMTERDAVAAYPIPMTDVPSAASEAFQPVQGRSRSVSVPAPGSSRPSRRSPRPCRTASRPPGSTAYGIPPSCHGGSVNSSSAGWSARASSPRRPTS
ncbi:hypothetical protein ACFQQB_38260 [Nonomuraea rubra]|uniref:hypothetical protein n=1 Tax=Nonomuraea rubra TaxID=46180 RepID=UPI003619370D